MVRKLSLGLFTMNLVVVLSTLCLFVPWCINSFKNLKIEMPTPVMWLIEASNFARSPWGAALLLAMCFLGWKALDKWAARNS